MSTASGNRWLNRHVGQEISTVQTKPSGITWEPGKRTLAKVGSKFKLDGSTVSIGKNHVVYDVTDSKLIVEWQDDDGVQISVTTYTVVE